MTIQRYPAPCDFPARRGRPAIAKGTTLYAIKKSGLFFIWSYISEDYAKVMDQRMFPQGAADVAANWRQFTRELSPSARTAD